MVPWSGRVHVDVTPEPELLTVQSTPRFGKAKERLAPRVQIAREKYVPAAELAALRTRQAVREELVPQVTAAVTAAMAASEPYRKEAQRRSLAAAAALRGAEVEVHEPEPETHRIRALLVTLGLGGIAAAAYKWFTGKEADSSWEQAYQPTPAQPTDATKVTVTSDVPPMTTDPGAAGPDEIMADSGEVPHQATTIDSPLEEQILDPDVPSDGQRSG
jgi:hypothetical protein